MRQKSISQISVPSVLISRSTKNARQDLFVLLTAPPPDTVYASVQSEGTQLSKWKVTVALPNGAQKIPCSFPRAAAVIGKITELWKVQELGLPGCTWLKSTQIIKIKASVSHYLTGDQCSPVLQNLKYVLKSKERGGFYYHTLLPPKVTNIFT